MPRVGIIVIANAIIWGFVIIGCSMALKGTGAYQEIQLILAGGALASLVLIGGLGVRKKPKE
ncbi:MAG: hypothetical protein H8E14_07590 [Candidatus Marinimicrobia bacterium]|nr:hypothetical protein [Candidatus Neomarinimicrobiota bacterium]